ncbi:MAG: hypothetical protein J6S42_07855, partial [Thermoguttaceae bacterium]|nr:hypothetical protein [Thermoguttaceae bacterium]
VRDESRLMADVGDCGREVCCKTYLTSMLSVNMKMAKLQKATLDPTKISGRCGRLKCCLTYEYEAYKELLAILPPVGSKITTPEGPGVVVGQELLAKRLQVEMEDRTRKYFTLAEIEAASAAPLPKGNPDDEIDDFADAADSDFPGSGLPAKRPSDAVPSAPPRRGERRRPKGRPARGERFGGKPENAGETRPEHRSAPHRGGRPSGPRKGGPRPFERSGPPRQGGGGKPPRQTPSPSDSPRRFRPENRDRGFHHKRKESE